jgi:hypothetical protein
VNSKGFGDSIFAQAGLIFPVLFSLYFKGIPTPSCHVKLAQYADDTALIATLCTPWLLVSYLEACLSRLELWLWDWKTAIYVTISTTVLFVKAVRHIQNPDECSFLKSQYSGS